MPERALPFTHPVQGPTFLGAPASDPLTVATDYAVIGIPFGVPYGIRQVHYGATDAPRAIRERSARFGGMLTHHDFDLGVSFAELGTTIADCGDVGADLRDLEGNARRATAAVSQLIARDAIPIVLGGDDSTTALSIAAFAARAPITVLQIDAHIDYRDEVQGIKGGYSSPMRRAAEMPWVRKIVHVGARGVGSARPQDLADTLARGNAVVTARDLRRQGAAAVMAHFKPGENSYIAFDCDGPDPSVMPGTSAPVPGGPGYADIAELLMAVCERTNVVGMNIAEHYPDRDVNGITALALTRLVVTVIGTTAVRAATLEERI